MMKRSVVVAIIGSAVVLSTAANLSFSIRSGPLSKPPIYDDVVYLLDAYQRLVFGGVHSLATLIASFLLEPPHAPMSTLTAMLGYSVVGPSVFAAYAANIWLLAGFAIATYLVARQNVDEISSTMVTVLMLFAPVSHALITEFRPDMGAGVLLASALASLLLVDHAKASRLQQLAIALLVVCAIMAKPSAVVATVPVLVVATFLGVFRPGLYSRSEMASSARSAILPFAIAAALLLPCIVVWGPNTYAYIHQALISNRDIWAADGSPLFHWTYNAFGPGGQLGLGAFLWLGLLVITLDVCFSVALRFNRDGYGPVAFYFAVALLYCGIATSPQKTVFQGSVFYFPFLLATTLALSRGISRVDIRARTMALAILLIGAMTVMPVASFFTADPGYRNSRVVSALVSDAVARVVASMHSEGCKTKRFVFAAMNPYPVTVEAVALSLAMNYSINVRPLTSLYSVRSAEIMAQEVDSADFVILSKGNEVPYLPGSKFTAQTLRRLVSSPEWHLISSTEEYALFAKTECS